jgi:drug/metabolite transporter (DMT)-like permease
MDLLFSVLASSLIFIIFKSFPKWKIDTLQAVIANYFVAFACGIFLFSDKIPSRAIFNDAIPVALICGVLFISLFIIMGLSSQKNGVASTSIAVKMSMALSVILVMLFNHALIGLSTILPLMLALIGVFLVSFTKNSTQEASTHLWMLGVLFLGSAGLDIVLYFSNSAWLPPGFHEGIFAALGFLMAGIMGLVYFIVKRLRGQIHFDRRSWVAGIVLGIPNFFSIYLLVKSYSTLPLAPQQILSLANVGVVLTSAILGLSIFKEKFSGQKIIGLILCIAALGFIIMLD